VASLSRPSPTKLYKTKEAPARQMREKLEEAFVIFERVTERKKANKEKVL
jgi:hypothetical protein